MYAASGWLSHMRPVAGSHPLRYRRLPAHPRWARVAGARVLHLPPLGRRRSKSKEWRTTSRTIKRNGTQNSQRRQTQMQSQKCAPSDRRNGARATPTCMHALLPHACTRYSHMHARAYACTYCTYRQKGGAAARASTSGPRRSTATTASPWYVLTVDRRAASGGWADGRRTACGRQAAAVYSTQHFAHVGGRPAACSCCIL